MLEDINSLPLVLLVYKPEVLDTLGSSYTHIGWTQTLKMNEFPNKGFIQNNNCTLIYILLHSTSFMNSM